MRRIFGPPGAGSPKRLARALRSAEAEGVENSVKGSLKQRPKSILDAAHIWPPGAGSPKMLAVAKENLSPSPRRTKYRIPLIPIPHPRLHLRCFLCSTLSRMFPSLSLSVTCVSMTSTPSASVEMAWCSRHHAKQFRIKHILLSALAR
jgi:hypothetical protein